MTEEMPFLRDLRSELQQRARHDATAAAARRHRPPTGLWMLAGGAAAVTAAVAVAFTSGLDSGRVTPPRANALERAAQAAQATSQPVPKADQFSYVHSTTTRLQLELAPGTREIEPQNIALITSDRRIWTSLERPGRLTEDPLTARYPAAPEKSTDRFTAAPPVPAPDRLDPRDAYQLGGLELTRRQLIDFPTDPTTIYSRVRDADEDPATPAAMFEQLGDALREGPAPPALRAGLYRALALVPGIELLGGRSDSRGRAGTAVAFTAGGRRSELIFDPETGDMLAEQTVITDPRQARLPLAAGTVIGDTVYLRRAVTDTTR